MIHARRPQDFVHPIVFTEKTPAVSRETNLSQADIADRLHEAIRTLAALPDRERRWVYSSLTAWPDTIRDEMEVFAQAVERVGAGRAGYDPMREPRETPTKEAIDRLDDTLRWLTLLDARECRIVTLRSRKIPWIKIAWSYGRSDETIRRWHAAAVERVWYAVAG